METKKLLVLASCLTLLALLTASCGPAAAPAPAATSKPAAVPTVASQPTAQPAAPATTPKPAAAAPTAKPASPALTPKVAAEQPRYGGIVTRALSRDPQTFDIQQAFGQPESQTIFNIYQGLVRLDPVGYHIAPELAEKWEVSPDGKSYTFHFSKDIRWHDGKPFTMEDVAYSLDRMKNPKKYNVVSLRAEGFLAAMDKVEIAGENAIKLTTGHPSASFLSGLASGWVAIAPKHILTVKGDMTKDTVGTGPFKLKRFIPDVSLELVKNPDYHIKGLPYLDGIVFYTIKDGSTRFAALRTKKILVTFYGAGSLTPTETEMVKREMSDKIMVYEHDSLTRQILTFNLNRKPWDDVRVRKAVDLAFDRQAAVKISERGYVGSIYPQPWGMQPEEVAKLPGHRQPKDPDIVEAKRLLAEAGLGGGLKTTLLAWASGQYVRQAEVAKDQLAKIGIDAEIVALDNVTREDRMRRGNFDLDSFRWTDNTGDPDETLYTNYYTKAGRNYASFSDKQVDELIDKQARTLDVNARKAILGEIQKRIMEQAPVLIIFWDVSQTGAWKEVKNFKPGPGLHPWGKFDQMWLAAQ